MKLLQGPHDFPANEADFFGNKQVPQGLIIDQSKKRRVLVYYIGGITYGEIAAIRFLNKIFTDRKFIIATTQIINGDACIEMLRGKINNRLNPNSLLLK
jgi:vacuolar protein sorting-associated protein 33A